MSPCSKMLLKFRCAWRVATHHTFAEHGPKATRERPENPTGVSPGAEQQDNRTELVEWQLFFQPFSQKPDLLGLSRRLQSLKRQLHGLRGAGDEFDSRNAR